MAHRQASYFRLWVAYIRPHTFRVALVVFATLLLSVIGLLHPWPYKILIDYVFGGVPFPEGGLGGFVLAPFAGDPASLLVLVIVFLIGIVLLAEAVDFVQNMALYTLSQRVLFRATSDLFAKIERLSLVFFSNQRIGDYVYRLTNDITVISGLISSFFIPLASSVFTFFGILAVMAMLSWKLAMIALIAVPFVFVVLRFFLPRLETLSRQIQQKESGLYSFFEQVLSEMKIVQAFTQEASEYRRFQEHLGESLSVNRKFEFTGNLLSFSQVLIVSVATAGVLLAGSSDIFAGVLTVGSLVVFMNYLGSLYGPLVEVTSSIGSYRTAKASLERVFEVLTAKDVVDESRGNLSARSVSGRLEFRHVFVTVPIRIADVAREHVEILHDIHFRVEPGQKVAVIGESGAGKTSLVSLISRLFDPSRGEVLLDGISLSLYDLHSLRNAVAIVPQEPILFSSNIRDNIAYGNPEASRDEIEEAARQASAHMFIERLPGGYKFVVGEQGMKLSGGQRQRIILARAFLKHARMFILDEPTTALDSFAQASVFEALSKLTEGKTTFIIAHSIQTVHTADILVVMQKGRIRSIGTHGKLLRTSQLYKKLYHESLWNL